MSPENEKVPPKLLCGRHLLWTVTAIFQMADNIGETLTIVDSGRVLGLGTGLFSVLFLGIIGFLLCIFGRFLSDGTKKLLFCAVGWLIFLIPFLFILFAPKAPMFLEQQISAVGKVGLFSMYRITSF